MYTEVDVEVAPLVQWVVSYFSKSTAQGSSGKTVNDFLNGKSPIQVTDAMPLILQHKGHSRLIVGYEVMQDKSINFISFDSATTIPVDMRTAAVQAHHASQSAGFSMASSTASSSSAGNNELKRRQRSDSTTGHGREPKRAKSFKGSEVEEIIHIPDEEEEEDEVVIVSERRQLPVKVASPKQPKQVPKPWEAKGETVRSFRVTEKTLKQ